MSDPDLYESLPDSTPLSVSMMAGATAGVAEHCVMFPVDTVKTRMQSLLCEKQHKGIRQVWTAMVTEEGGFKRSLRYTYILYLSMQHTCLCNLTKLPN